MRGIPGTQGESPIATRERPGNARPAASERSLPALIATAAARAPDAPALLAAGGRSLSFGALERHVREIGRALRGFGVEPTDRVAVVLPNGPEMAAAFLGVACAAACAPLNPAYRASELEFYLTDIRARALVTSGGLGAEARRVAKACGISIVELAPAETLAAGLFELEGASKASAPSGPPLAPEDIALVLHTSGTTSRPKLVPLSHRNLSTSAENVSLALELGPGDRCLSVMPLFHIHGLVAALLASLHAGASVACTPGFEPRGFFGWLEELEPTWYTAVPTMHQSVVAHAPEHSRLLREARIRLVRSSSASLPAPVLEGLEDTFGAPVLEAYGMTEAAHQMTSNPLPPGMRKPGSVGLPAGPEIRVLDEAGRELKPGEIGEIAIRGENVFAGYEANPEANAEAFTGEWFRTGDEGYLDEEGYLFLRGRLKEIINRGGEKISPREVDETLLRHPSVAQAVTFGVPHPSLGEEVAAAVVLRTNDVVRESEIRAFALQRLAAFKVPRRVLVLDELPKGATGKVQRIGLAERLGLSAEDGPVRPPFVEPRTELERGVAELWEELLGTGPLGLDDDFFALGGDSIVAEELMAEVVARGWAHGWPMAAMLLLAPTVGRFAHMLEHGGLRLGDSPLVPLRSAGTGEPLFLVHTHEGHVLHYLPLALALDDERPVYALQARGADGSEQPHESIEAMAAAYVAEIRAVQPDGRYWLGGSCMGGMIAFEMARQLASAGADVAVALLVDPSPGVRSRLTRAYHGLVFQGRQLAIHTTRGDLHRSVQRKLAAAFRRARGGPGAQSAGGRRRAPERERFLEAMATAREGHVTGVYGGAVVVLRSQSYDVPRRFWTRRAPGARFVDLPRTITLEQRAATLGERMGEALAGDGRRDGGRAP